MRLKWKLRTAEKIDKYHESGDTEGPPKHSEEMTVNSDPIEEVQPTVDWIVDVGQTTEVPALVEATTQRSGSQFKSSSENSNEFSETTPPS